MTNTVIGPRIRIEGEVSGDEPLVVQGQLKGAVVLQATVHVEPGGLVEADVTAPVVVVAGTLEGTLTATERAEVTPGGRMLGTVKTPRLLIADGALFKGTIDMDV